MNKQEKIQSERESEAMYYNRKVQKEIDFCLFFKAIGVISTAIVIATFVLKIGQSILQ